MDWIQNSTLHPVISQNFYRVKNGRIEMLSMAWLKHGFSVAAGSACNTCTDPASNYLGVGCSDPYGSSLNGSHNYAGPRSQVNALTGAFIWPRGSLTNPGTLDGRMRLRYDDLNPDLNPGARYFCESMYVHPQDAAAGNGLNNASYREMTVQSQSGGNFTISFPSTSSTVREQPAINAWKLVHPDVRLFNVDIPGEGRIVVGMRTTPRAGGGYHTEFAIENFNSHQSVRSLAVNFGSNAISNPGFRDVNYLQEPYSGTDWTPTVANNRIEWSTQTFTENANANAIRWNTMYSFWCDSDLPPRKLTLGMFRPGTVSEMNVDLINPIIPVSYTLDGATATGGQFSNVFMSDNQDFRLTPIVRKRTPYAQFNIESTLPTDSPIDFALRLEASMVGLPYGEVAQVVELFNYDTGNYELIDARPAEISDQPLEITPTGDWSRFIQDGTRLVKARIEWRYIVENGRNPYSWVVDIDESVWLVTQ
jgi:hypothetical protein